MGIAAAARRIAPPRTPVAQTVLQRYERLSRPVIVAAAIVPLLVSPGEGRHWANLICLLSWLVFLADFIVQSRLRVRYLASKFGMMDMAIVVITSPWYLIPGMEVGAFVVLARFARLARVIVVARGARRLLDRLGRAALFAVIAVMVFALIAWRAEAAVNPGFASYGDAVWWACVTITTVGYGDIVPITVPGRAAGVLLMVAGMALVGVLAGSLASFFRITPQEERNDDARHAADRRDYGLDGSARRDGSGSAQPEPPPGTPPGEVLAQLRGEVAELRLQIGRLSDVMAVSHEQPTRPGRQQ
jgi:voltage-gated potassium channel